MTSSKLSTVLNELRAIPEIETVGLGYCIPIEGASGNNVSLPNEEKELFNIADFYWVDENYLSILNIQVTEGNSFSPKTTAPFDLLISQKGAQMLAMNTGWKDGVSGKQINVSEHGTYTIQGVFPDFIINSISNSDSRPAIFSYLPEDRFQEMIDKNPSFSFYILAKAHEGAQAGIIKKMTNAFNLALPYQDAVIKCLKDEQTARYSSEKGFRNAMLAGNAIILLITVMGLLGYIVTEVTRRRKELAIRKINGARLSDILRIFIMDLEYIAIPAVIIGLVGAWFTASKWMENFATKIPLNWGIFALCSLTILVLIALIATVNYLVVVNRNPVEALRYE
jgi:putative ABC transport system permease protein